MKKRTRKKIERGARVANNLAEKMHIEGITLTDLVRQANISPTIISKIQAGRKVSPRTQVRIVETLNKISGKEYKIGDIFLHVEPDQPWPRK